jgi:hypothetical protein
VHRRNPHIKDTFSSARRKEMAIEPPFGFSQPSTVLDRAIVNHHTISESARTNGGRGEEAIDLRLGWGMRPETPHLG